MKYPYFAAVAVRLIERVPAVVWAVWILGIIIGSGFMALRGGPAG
jgi:hypothetical protein